MGNKNSNKTTILKEEIVRDLVINNNNNRQQKIINNPKLNDGNNLTKINGEKNDYSNKNLNDKQNQEQDEISQLEEFSMKFKKKNRLRNIYENNSLKERKQKSLKTNFKTDYVIDINKIKKRKNGKRAKIPKKFKNFISTSKYTWYNFIPKILYEQFSKMSNIYFIIIALLQCFPEISNADGKPIILFPLSVVILVNSIKDFYEDWKRKKSDDEENNRKVEVFDLDKKDFVIKKWKNIIVGNIVKIKKNEYFPADCVLISSSDKKTHNCFVETKNLDGETNFKIKKSINKFVQKCSDLNSFQGRLTTQMPNEYIYQFDAIFDFDDNNNQKEGDNNDNDNYYQETNSKMIKNDIYNNNKKINEFNLNEENDKNIKSLIQEDIENQNSNEENIEENNNINNTEENEESEKDYSVHTYFTKRKNKKGEEIENKSNESIIIDQQNFLLRGCSLRQTESVLCFVVYTGKNTKIMQNSPSSRAKTSSLEKRMNSQIKYIFLFQLILSLTASFFSLIQIIKSGGNPTPYLSKEGDTSYVNFEEYSKKIYKIIFETNYKKIFNKKDSIFIIMKNLFKELSPMFDLYVLIFFILKLGTWCVLMNNLVPISLLMTMELVKYFQGWFISWDIDIYDKEKHIMTKVQTSTLNEELGQVKYIFSDKTGTLTKNYMNFKRVTIGYNQYNKPIIKDINNSINIYSTKKEKENKSDIAITVNVNRNKENKDKNDDINNTDSSMIKKNEMKINVINEEKTKNNKIEFYKDDYGIITNVLFLDDEQLKQDMKLNQNQKHDIEKIKQDINYDSNSSSEEGDEDNNSLNNNIDYNKTEQKTKKITQEKYLDLFLTAISTCHSGIISEKEFDKEKKIIYQASSPDEIAILNFARKYKYIFFGRKDNNKIIIEKPKIPEDNISKEKVIYKVHIQFEFSSERKSMSIIVQNTSKPEEIFLFIKGADDVILSKIDKKNKNNRKIIKNIENSLDEYSKEGLRILVVAFKKISLKELKIYKKEYINACKSTYDKKEKLEALANKIENNLILLGVTGIQDELQDDVYETLKDFSDAGIKLWVLTGDKKATAKSISLSCGLFDDINFNIFEIKEGLNKAELESSLNELVERFNNIVDNLNLKTNKKIEKLNNTDNMNINNQNKIVLNKNEKKKTKFALIISSYELDIISLNYELEILFYELASRCNSVICCRVSPIQKAKMVHLIQCFTKLQQHKGANYYKYFNQQETYHLLKDQRKIKGPLKNSITTLAIGDGANDVNMITSAHIGVGICGLEGKQAARASDYAIGQFKFLKKLLFYHGHESLRKNSFIICYNFYKNFLFVMPLFYVGFYSFFSGQSIYDPWLYQLYNIAFTVLPIIWLGIYDSERSRNESLNNPKYYSSLNQKWFNSWKFWEWIFYGIIQGYAVFFFVYSSNNIYSNNIDGEIQDFKCSGAMAYSLVIIIANLKVFQVTSVYGFISLFFLIISIGSYYGLIYLMDKNYSVFYFGIFWRMIKNYRYYLIMGCLSLGLTLIGAGIVQLQKIFSNYDRKEKHYKILFSFKEMRRKRNKNKNDKKQTKGNNNELDKNIIVEEEGNKQKENLIEEEIFENKSFDEKL